ncbi:MAG: hypothetical protein J7639_21730 [Paenibacillaceae bacterium]|nr:hypothetical protein [Paenibacillaceae bacterium]
MGMYKLAFIGTGAGVAYEALQTVNSWNDADDAINDAYHYIEQILGYNLFQ